MNDITNLIKNEKNIPYTYDEILILYCSLIQYNIERQFLELANILDYRKNKNEWWGKHGERNNSVMIKVIREKKREIVRQKRYGKKDEHC